MTILLSSTKEIQTEFCDVSLDLPMEEVHKKFARRVFQNSIKQKGNLNAKSGSLNVKNISLL